MLSRRRLLAAAGAVLSTAACGSMRKTAGRMHFRPFDWSDAYGRCEVEAAVVSPLGPVAIQVIRPLSAGGTYGGYSRRGIQPRGEIWLLDANLNNPRRLGPSDLWAWAPSFSPGGQRLAALASTGDGRVGLSVWDVLTQNRRVFLELDLDIDVPFARGTDADARPGSGYPYPKQFIWRSEETLLYVQAAAEPETQFELDLTRSNRTYAALRDRTFKGDRSVRVWNADSPVCGQTRTLVQLDSTTGNTRAIHKGPLRGVSLAPDGRYVAALVANGHIAVSGNNPMPSAVLSTGVGDDPLVSLGVVLIDLGQAQRPRSIDSFCGVGAVAPSRLPKWSADSSHFAVPGRASYTSKASSGDDACWCVRLEDGHVDRRPATSMLDAELIAALCAAAPSEYIDSALSSRPILAGAANPDLVVGESPGAVWVSGRDVVVWDREWLTVFDGAVSRPLLRGCRSVSASLAGQQTRQFLVLMEDDSVCLILDSRTGASNRRIPWNPNWICLGLGGSDGGSAVVKHDSESGTHLWLATARKRPRVSSLVLNRHFEQVLKPAVREVSYLNPAGRELKGVLQLPVGRSATTRHPVVIWAYPDDQPTLDGWITRTNHDLAVCRPFQYLLTQGFAVFQTPLEMPRDSSREPLEAVTRAVLPWLDVLDRQPDIAPGEYGFFGHSNAGYVALALEALSQRFKAIVAYSTFPDLGITSLTASPSEMALECAGPSIQANRSYYEDPQLPYGLGTTVWANEATFLRNSPLHRLESAITPLLLLQSEFDYGARAMEAVYSILAGRGVPVELAYYWGEGHMIRSPRNVRDLWERTARFLRKYLRVQD